MEMEYVTTTCPYCGTGCGLNLIVANGKAVGVAPYHRSPVGSGKLCTRGLHAAKALSEWRIEKPSVKGEPVTWDEAVAEAKKLAAYSGDEIAVAISSRLTNEAMFLAACYAREVLGAANIGIVGGGCGASTTTITDLAKADTALMIGDVMKRLPVTGRRLYRVQANGGRLLYLGPESYTAVQADTAVIADEYTKIPEELSRELTAAANPVVMYLAGTQRQPQSPQTFRQKPRFSTKQTTAAVQRHLALTGSSLERKQKPCSSSPKRRSAKRICMQTSCRIWRNLK